jgi:hypothetical protein
MTTINPGTRCADIPVGVGPSSPEADRNVGAPNGSWKGIGRFALQHTLEGVCRRGHKRAKTLAIARGMNTQRRIWGNGPEMNQPKLRIALDTEAEQWKSRNPYLRP